jgi:hypothetical protein
VTGVATAIGGAAVIGAGATAYASGQSANSAKNAQNIAQQQYANNVQLENPYNQAGLSATNQLNYLLGDGATPGTTSTAGGAGSLLSPFTTQTFQQMSPNFQFQQQQGRNGVLNQAAGGQGALSGAALQGLTDYNQASSNNAFNNAFQQNQEQQSNIYSRLAGIANLGQSAASGTAQTGTALAGTAANAAVAQGQALANGATGVASSLGQGATNGAIWAQYGGGGSSVPSTADANSATNAAGFTNSSGVLNPW